MHPGRNFENILAQATNNHRDGRLAKAETLYRLVLSDDSRHEKALFGLSVLALQSQRNQLAVELLGRLIEVEQDNPAYYSNLGEAYRRLGRRREAVNSLLQSLSRKPDFAEGYYNLALVLQDNNEHSGALVYFEQAADLKPDSLIFQRALALALVQTGDLKRAVGHHTCAWLLGDRSARALEALVVTHSALGQSEAASEWRRRGHQSADRKYNPGSTVAETAHQQALALERLGDAQGALAHHEFAAFTQPDEVRYQVDLARSLQALGALGRAVAHYHCVMALTPRSAQALVSLSAVLKDLGRSVAAAATSERALGIESESALAHASLAAARVDQQRNEEAIASCKRAIELDPGLWLAHFQLGNALVGCGKLEAALDCFRRTIALCPTQHVAHSNLVFLLSYVSGVSTEAIGREARDWARQRADPLAQEITAHTNDRTPQRCLRIGYVSPDFRDHPVASFVLPLFEHHDRRRFEVFCYSSVHRADSVTERLRARADGWRDVASAGDVSVAELVRSDGIDVLVDLTMHSGGGRPRLFARKPSPVQICWLAYVGTTGLSTMDYRITDPHLDPPGLDPGWCTEAPLQLPDTFWCYQPIDPAPDVRELPALTSGYITFGSQHSFHKIHRGVIQLWARVLRSVDGSRLILYAPPSSRGSLTELFLNERIDASRVEFLPLRARREYFEAYHRIDVSLDTFPYNGATTSLDATYMGVPVLTLLGETPVGRAGYSIASNLGLPELIATSEDDYVMAAVKLTQDLGRLSEFRADLRDRMAQSPLMDAARFARNLETAYRKAWTAWCASDPNLFRADKNQG
jgi:predicted O-linked N-acetylglucosamine transferase (SPINDLY family)